MQITARLSTEATEIKNDTGFKFILIYFRLLCIQKPGLAPRGLRH